MTAMLYGQVAVNALMLGATYALIAVGLSLVFSIMRVIQFAHGNLYMLGAYCVFYLATDLGVNYFAALFIARHRRGSARHDSRPSLSATAARAGPAEHDRHARASPPHRGQRASRVW